LRVLLADDDPVTRRMLQAALEKWGYDVVICTDGMEAWNELAKADCPKLAMIDWMMPEMDGPTICRGLREDSTRPYTYVLLFTSKDRREDLLRGLDAGADDYLIKPFDRTELKLRLRIGERIVRLQDQLIQARDDFERQATLDPLTGLYNRRVILDRLEKELEVAIENGKPLSIAIADVDKFKAVNDNHGHLVGDRALTEVAAAIRLTLDSAAITGRYGGEEFLIVLPGLSVDEALPQMEEVRESINRLSFSELDEAINITLSVGMAETSMEKGVTVDEMIKIADKALYSAKRLGRNRVEIAADPVTPDLRP
jgi:diguanylate cyclase (GGDEF)-like protein